MLLRAARTSVSTATAASADALKQRVRELYLEQLLQRERPQGRTGQGWSRILKTAQDALENRLAELHCVDEIHAFALRCIKDDHLREVYLSFCVEDISEFALPAETVHNVVFSSEEHPNFTKTWSCLNSQRPQPLLCQQLRKLRSQVGVVTSGFRLS